jgi:hypothetical protein
MRAEISYDLKMQDDMSFVEGTYRLPGSDLQVFIFLGGKQRNVPETEVLPQVWDSGVTGVAIRFPRERRLNMAVVEEVLSAAFGVKEWVRVRGPDSMNLR